MKNNSFTEIGTGNGRQSRGAVSRNKKSVGKHGNTEDSERTEKEQQGYVKEPTEKNIIGSVYEKREATLCPLGHVPPRMLNAQECSVFMRS